jgi:hypothetical protein
MENVILICFSQHSIRFGSMPMDPPPQKKENI